jgi:hypothetical protein
MLIMHGIEIAEKDHSVVITVDPEVIERWRIEQALSLLEVRLSDAHIPSMDPREQEEIAAHLQAMTPDDRRYTVIREG